MDQFKILQKFQKKPEIFTKLFGKFPKNKF